MAKKESLKVKFNVNMNDPDQLEIDLLTQAHSMVVDDELEDSFHHMGRMMKPLFSGFCEALRVQKQYDSSRGAFLDAMVNFTSMVLVMTIRAGVKPAKLEETANQTIKTIREDFDAMLSRAAAKADAYRGNDESIKNLGIFSQLLKDFLADSKKEKKDG